MKQLLPPPLDLSESKQYHPDIIIKTAEQIHNLLWTFSWAYPDGEPRGEIHVDTSKGQLKLHLLVWVPDNDNAEDRSVKELSVTRSIDYRPAALQIRAIIHWFLCHEADEQMFFDGARPFDPHCMPGQDRKTDGSYIRSAQDRNTTLVARQLLGVS